MLNENAFAQCSCWSAACQMNICYTYQLLYYAATPYLILAIRIASAYCKEPINQLYYTNIVYFSTRNQRIPLSSVYCKYGMKHCFYPATTQVRLHANPVFFFSKPQFFTRPLLRKVKLLFLSYNIPYFYVAFLHGFHCLLSGINMTATTEMN